MHVLDESGHALHAEAEHGGRRAGAVRVAVEGLADELVGAGVYHEGSDVGVRGDRVLGADPRGEAERGGDLPRVMGNATCHQRVVGREGGGGGDRTRIKGSLGGFAPSIFFSFLIF